MANVNAPKGFVPLRHLLGGVIRANTHTIASAYGTRVGRGDPVKMHSDGTIVRAAAGEVLLGICKGFKYVDSLGNQVFTDVWVAGTVATEIEAYVYDDPFIVFAVQVDGTLSAGDIGACADIVVANYDLTTKTSQCELSASVGSGTAQCKIIGLGKEPNNAWGANVDVEVLLNEHFFKQEAGI